MLLHCICTSCAAVATAVVTIAIVIPTIVVINDVSVWKSTRRKQPRARLQATYDLVESIAALRVRNGTQHARHSCTDIALIFTLADMATSRRPNRHLPVIKMSC